jgi:hypothetical protein
VDRDVVDKINRKVAKQHPEMKGVHPTVRREPKSKRGGVTYSLTYKGQANLPGGQKLKRVVRVVATEEGRILRMSTSK